MPTMFAITLKAGAPPAELDKAKESAKAQGGTIKHEYTLIKGFTCEFPNETVHTLQSDKNIHVEQDGEARIK